MGYRASPQRSRQRGAAIRPLIDWLLEGLQLHPGERLLEVGCGVGLSTLVFAAQGVRVWGVERDPQRAAMARGRVPEARIIEGDGLLGLPDDAPFDAIVAGGSVRHVPAAWFAQLTPTGRLVVPVGAPDAVQELLCFDRDPYGRRRRRRLTTVACDPLVG